MERSTTTAGGQIGRIVLGWALVILSTAMCCLLFGSMIQVQASLAAQETKKSGSWSHGTLYLSTTDSTSLSPTEPNITCVITPTRGQPRTVTVPAAGSHRGIDLEGRIVARWFTGPATVECPEPISMNTQPASLGFWLGERPALILLWLAVFGIGWLALPSDHWLSRALETFSHALGRLPVKASGLRRYVRRRCRKSQ